MANGTDIAKAYVQIIPSAEGIKGKLEEIMGDEADSAGKKSGGKFGKAFGNVLKTAGKIGAAALGAAATGIGALTKSAVEGYAAYEQLVGGVETLFGAGGATLQEFAASIGKTAEGAMDEYGRMMTAQNTVLRNASDAFRTAGLSTNEYMETVTSFSASLISSLEGNTLAAANAADLAIRDMSDNANKMGTDMGAIQNAYQGFAKQNYTMLDNLKLGYGGTKTEMERLLQDATALSGIEYDIDNLADVYSAIHVIQDELGITGTTAKEAAETISGSKASLSAAWEDLLSAVGGEGGEDLAFLAPVPGKFRPIGNVIHQLYVHIGKSALFPAGKDTGLGKRSLEGSDGVFQRRLVLNDRICVQGFRFGSRFVHGRVADGVHLVQATFAEILICPQFFQLIGPG